MESMQFNKKGFTLTEIIVVVVIVGVLATIALLKFSDARERAEVAYLKNMISMVDAAMERVITTDGSFPAIVSTSPEDRLAEILIVLQEKGLFVWMEKTYGDKWNLAYQTIGKPLIAAANNNVGVQNMLETNRSARKGLESGNPMAREILILPVTGPIVYPERPVLVLNNPEAPDYTFHYKSYWLPKEVDAAIAKFRNGGFDTEAERNLVMNNLTYGDFTAEELKILLAATQNSVEHSLAANQLAAILRGEVEGGKISKEQAQSLLDSMLHDPNYDPSTLDLSGLDLSKFDNLSLIRIAKNEKLDADQIDYLLSKLSTASPADKLELIKGLVQNGGLTGVKFNALASAIGSDLSNLRSSYSWANALTTSTLGDEEKANRLGLITSIFKDDLKNAYTVASNASSQDYASYMNLVTSTGVWNTWAAEARQEVALDVLNKTLNTYNNSSLTEAIRNGSVEVTRDMVTASIDKFLSSSKNNTAGTLFGTVLDGGSTTLSETEKQQVRAWFGEGANYNPYAVSYHSYLFSDPNIFNSAESLEPAIRNGITYGMALNGQSATDALKNPNISSSQLARVVDAVIANPNYYLALDLNTDRAAIEAINSKADSNTKLRLLNAALLTPNGNLSVAGELTYDTAGQALAYQYLANTTTATDLTNKLSTKGTFSQEQLQDIVSSSTIPSVVQGIISSAVTPAGTRVGTLTLEETQGLLTSALANETTRGSVLSSLAAGGSYRNELLPTITDIITQNIGAVTAASNFINPVLIENMTGSQRNDLADYYASTNYQTPALKNAGVDWMSEDKYEQYADYVLSTVATNSPAQFQSYVLKPVGTEALLAKAVSLASSGQTDANVIMTVGNLVASSSPATYAQNASAIMSNATNTLDAYSAGIAIGASLNSLNSTTGSTAQKLVVEALTTQLGELALEGKFSDFIYGANEMVSGNATLASSVLNLAKKNLITAEQAGLVLALPETFDKLSLEDKRYVQTLLNL
jgi:prepilin-type N-terminal cleavage/methylation domain-containing protein